MLIIILDPEKMKKKYYKHTVPSSFCLFVCLFVFNHARGMHKFLGQGSNLCHSSNPNHSSDNSCSSGVLKLTVKAQLKCVLVHWTTSKYMGNIELDILIKHKYQLKLKELKTHEG